jgi:hypothetical protein
VSFSSQRKGAGGSWAEPYFACHLRRKWGFAYPVAVDEKFEKIALKLGRTKRQVFIQMVDYFYKSKKVPSDLNDELWETPNSFLVNISPSQKEIAFLKKRYGKEGAKE